jgi:hypothetical protein
LEDVRFKVLNGFICDFCRQLIAEDGMAHVPDDIEPVLGMDWLGTTADPGTPARTVAKLGFDLFATKGLKSSIWEQFLGSIQDDGIKELTRIVGALLLAIILVWLGLKH